MRVELRDAAVAELNEAEERYRSIRVGLGARFVHEFDATLQRILLSPKGYAQVDGDTRHARMHTFPHAVYFRIVGEVIVVLAVFHPRRNPSDRSDRR